MLTKRLHLPVNTKAAPLPAIAPPQAVRRRVFFPNQVSFKAQGGFSIPTRSLSKLKAGFLSQPSLIQRLKAGFLFSYKPYFAPLEASAGKPNRKGKPKKRSKSSSTNFNVL